MNHLKILRALAIVLPILAVTARAELVTAAFDSATTVPITAAAYPATGNSVEFALNFTPPVGTDLTVVRNTGPELIQGFFDNLAQGQTVFLSHGGLRYRFIADYRGGDGNDLILRWAGNRAFALGLNSSGQLGTIASANSIMAVPVDGSGMLNGKSLTGLAAGGSHTLACCADGTLAAWGYNGTGQLGNGTTSISPVSVPQAVTISPALTGRTPVSIAAGSYFNVVVCADGTLITWGYNTTGQLGTGTLTNSSLPVAVTASPALFGKLPAAVAAGSGHGLALCADGTLVAWGGGLGSGNTTATTVPLRVTATGVLAGQTVAAIAAGGNHSLVLLTDGTLASWGYNYDGQLGNGNQLNALIPVPVDRTGALAGHRVTGIAAGASHSLAFGDSSAFAWGYNKSGPLGDGSSLTRSNLPVLVATSTLASGTKFAMVASGPAAEHSLAVVGLPLVADATLSGLTLDPGSLSPNFNSGTLNYTASVPAATTTLRVTPNATDANATIRVNGNPVVSGTPSEAIAITSIPTTITVQVIAQNGADNKIYIIAITNVAPSFAGYAVATPYQTAVTIPLAKLLANAADANGDALTVTAAGPLSANGGVVTLQASGIGYTPPNNFSGADTFPVTITDAGGASVVGAVTVAVGPPPDAGGAGVNPPVLTTLPDGKVAIAFHGIPGRGYVVQRSVGGLGDWITLTTVVADASGRISFTDEAPPAGSAFYRLGTP
jgi:alpha-tubulin suppressor-like RCC1 family protein